MSTFAAAASAFVAVFLAVQNSRRLQRRMTLRFDLFTLPRTGDCPGDKTGVALAAINTGLVPVCVIQIALRLRNGDTWLGTNDTCFLAPSSEMPQVVAPGSEVALCIYSDGLDNALISEMVFGFVHLATGETFFTEWIENARDYFSSDGKLNRRNYEDIRKSAELTFGKQRCREIYWESALPHHDET